VGKAALKRSIAILSYLTVFALVISETHSTAELLIAGGGLVLLLDRYIFRLLSWPSRQWKKEVCLRLGSFFLGALFFFLIRPGIVPVLEAAYRGVMLCLAIAILEQITWALGRICPSRWTALAIVGLCVIAVSPVVAFLHPLRTVPKRGPESLGLGFDDVRFRSADQTQLAAWVIPAEHARGNAIFCHGHGRCRGQGLALFPLLHSLNLNIVAFDFRGHGDSDGHVSTFGDREVKDLQAATEYVRERYPGQPLFLIGVSLGAAVSLQALPTLGKVSGVWSEGAFARLDDEVDHEFRWLPRSLRSPVVKAYNIAGWIDCEFWAPLVNPVDSLEDVDVPIFFCHGTRDELVPIGQAGLLYDRYRGSKQCWWVEGASHYNVRQHNQNEYHRRLATFVQSCLANHGR